MKELLWVLALALQWITLIIVMTLLLPIFLLSKNMDKWRRIINLKWREE